MPGASLAVAEGRGSFRPGISASPLTSGSLLTMNRTTYRETFDVDRGGWLGWQGGGGGALRLPRFEGALVSSSPWGVDINHAPPGAGYMHLLFCLPTMPPDLFPYERVEPFGDANRFVKGEYSRDFTNCRVTVRVRGEVALKGAQLMLHVQADVGPVRTNWLLSGQPIAVGPQWREQTLTLTPEASQWTYMGVRRQGADCDKYGHAPIAEALRDVNINLILVLGTLEVVPREPITGDPHELRAGKDYPVDWARLPKGEIWLDTVELSYPE
jgi:hypothetical protein